MVIQVTPNSSEMEGLEPVLKVIQGWKILHNDAAVGEDAAENAVNRKMHLSVI